MRQTFLSRFHPSNVVLKVGFVLAIIAALMIVTAITVFGAGGPPTITVAGVNPGSQVTLTFNNLPVNDTFAVSMGDGTGVGVGPVVAHFDTGAGGQETYTFEILTDVKSDQKVSVRIDDGLGVTAFVVFDNTVFMPTSMATVAPSATAVTSVVTGTAVVPVTGATATPAGSSAATATVAPTTAATSAATTAATAAATTAATATVAPTTAATAAATTAATATVAPTTAATSAATTAATAAATTASTPAAGAATSTPAAAGTATPAPTTATTPAAGTATPAPTTATTPAAGTATVAPTTATTPAAGTATNAPTTATTPSTSATAVVPVTGATPVATATVSPTTGPIHVLHVEQGGWVQVQIDNLPLNTLFSVTVGPAGSQGFGGYKVGDLPTESLSSHTSIFEIPVPLSSASSLDLRLEAPGSLYLITFDNTNK